MPTRRKVAAAAIPPMPAPTMATDSGLVLASEVIEASLPARSATQPNVLTTDTACEPIWQSLEKLYPAIGASADGGNDERISFQRDCRERRCRYESTVRD